MGRTAGRGACDRLPLSKTEGKENPSRSPMMLTYLCSRSYIYLKSQTLITVPLTADAKNPGPSLPMLFTFS